MTIEYYDRNGRLRAVSTTYRFPVEVEGRLGTGYVLLRNAEDTPDASAPVTLLDNYRLHTPYENIVLACYNKHSTLSTRVRIYLRIATSSETANLLAAEETVAPQTIAAVRAPGYWGNCRVEIGGATNWNSAHGGLVWQLMAG